ncbi:MAG: RDD family protein [Moorellales bacterium]
MQKAWIAHRILAYLIDAVVGGLLSLIPFVGGILGFFYFLLRDGLGEGQGVGKRLVGLRVVEYPGQGGANFADSARRNLVFAVPMLLLVIPVFGRIMYAVVMILVWVLEIYLVLTDPQGRRLGDRWAGTMVIETRK